MARLLVRCLAYPLPPSLTISSFLVETETVAASRLLPAVFSICFCSLFSASCSPTDGLQYRSVRDNADRLLRDLRGFPRLFTRCASMFENAFRLRDTPKRHSINRQSFGKAGWNWCFQHHGFQPAAEAAAGT